MHKTKNLLFVMAAFAIATPAVAEVTLGVGADVGVRVAPNSGVKVDMDSDDDIDVKATSAIKLRANATGSVEVKGDKGHEDGKPTTTPENRGEGEEHRSERGEERSVSGHEFFKAEGLGGLVVTPRTFHVDGDAVRTWTKEDEDRMKARGASDDEVSVVLEAKSDEHVSKIDIDRDEKTGRGTVVVKYDAKVKILGFIPVTASLVATSSDSGAAVEVDAPWYVRWFASTSESETIALSLAGKIKARHDASLDVSAGAK